MSVLKFAVNLNRSFINEQRDLFDSLLSGFRKLWLTTLRLQSQFVVLLGNLVHLLYIMVTITVLS